MMDAKQKLSLAKKMAKENHTKTLKEIAGKHKLSIQQIHNMVKLANTSVDEVRQEFVSGNIKFSDIPKIIKLKDEKETKDRLVKFVRMNVEDSKKPSNTIGNMLKELKNEIQKNRSINKNKAKFMQNLISAMEEKNKQKVLEAIGEDQ